MKLPMLLTEIERKVIRNFRRYCKTRKEMLRRNANYWRSKEGKEHWAALERAEDFKHTREPQ